MKSNPLAQNKFYWIFLVGFFLILALPLLSVPPWFHPSAWGKTIVFRTILSILIFLFIGQILFQKGKFGLIQRIGLRLSSVECLQRISAVKIAFWLLITLFGIFLLATIFSLDSNFSFWGSPYRAGGFLNFSFYIIFALLVFFILKAGDWKKIWDFAILIGILVSVIAIFQQFGLLKEIFITLEARPHSTIGGPIFLAIYLLLLSFLAIVFGIREKNLFKKSFYFLSLFLFLFVIFLTYTRAAYFGLAIGILYFLLFYPAPEQVRYEASPKKLTWLKVSALILLILGIYGVYYINTQPELPNFLQENKILQGVVSRLSIETVLKDPRISGWQVAWQATKTKPILGYGPENFSIGFDRYYDPGLPEITFQPGGGPGGWWDRAHNFVFDISATAGIPALIIYLSLFGVLFWQLQRLKSAEKYADNNAKITQNKVIYHGIQATFIGYLVANFFSFDTFSTYLISFLLIGYSMHLIAENNADSNAESTPNSATDQRTNQRNFSGKSLATRIFSTIIRLKIPILGLALVLLVWFIWSFNLKPLQINREINWANYYSKNQKCDKALEKMEKILPSRSIIDNYLRLQYIDIIRNCLVEEPERKLELSQKAIQILKENIKLRPYYTRNWSFLGAYTNIFIEKSKDLEPELKEELLKEANSYLEKAHQLSPTRQEVFLSWIKTDILSEKYQGAKEKAEQCINLNPEFKHCWWEKAICNIYLGEVEEAKGNMEIAAQKGYSVDSKASLLQLVKVYTDLEHSKTGGCNLGTEDYKTLVDVYQKLIALEPSKFQHHASLAYTYKCLEDYKKARSEALIVLKLSPESRESVEEFLRSLPR